ncbi:DAO-domain-containing protein [Coprinellus micaceus]|uniref:Glycerol-3-phosphate dehydrogenase n=1 Tax=Coprinellus micaceus TaxID=71717 RepID=A0A4Y7T0Y2_COPMI|nr:DAO-domain-containing protein [Coprinellus micaceus]
MQTRRPPPPWTPASRSEMLKDLKASGTGEEEEFDLLIIGGGATGAGVAVDAASRGLKVALVERDDFSAGASFLSSAHRPSQPSSSTAASGTSKKAVFELDYDQYKLVKEALHERKIFLETAPYLSNMLPIMLPIYKYWQVPYYLAGCKMYDILAGKENMETSYVMSKGKALETFPMLKSDGLVGAVVYYDGQHNDSRMNIALIMTAHKPIVQASSGVHITLPNYYSPRTMGLLDPATSDGRVIFFLPWQGNTIAGTTDSPSRVTRDPEASEEDIRWVLDEVRSYLSPDIKVRRGDVLSAWSGLRPLVKDPDAAPGTTAGLVRSHVTTLSESGLLTIAGGKWTTYRKMAEETVDEAVKVFGLEGRCKKECGYGLESEVARHLSDNYGSRAWTVCSLAEPTHTSWPLHGTRLSRLYPFIDAEVTYAVRHEYALTAIDVLARRTRLSFLNARAALDALPGVVEIMGRELGWGREERSRQVREAVAFLVGSMGLQGDRESLGREGIFGLGGPVGHHAWVGAGEQREKVMYGRARFQPSEIIELRKAFAAASSAAAAFARGVAGGEQNENEREKEKEGAETVGLGDVLGVVRDLPGYGGVSEKDLSYVVGECGLGGRERVELDEFIEICGSLKDVAIAPTASFLGPKRSRIPVEKSGGGV